MTSRLSRLLVLSVGVLAVSGVLAGVSFFPRVDYSVSPGVRPNAVVAGDIDGDGDIDLCTANFNSQNVTVLRGLGDGSFSVEAPVAAGNMPVNLTLIDFDADNDLDLAVALYDFSNQIALLENTAGNFTFLQTVPAGVRPGDVTSGDVNNDGFIDLVVANFDAHTVTVLENTAGTGFTTSGTYAVGRIPWSVICVDLDGVNGLDIAAVGNGSPSSVAILLNDGFGGFGAATYPTAMSGLRDVAAGDLDDDGFVDLVAGTGTNQVVVLWGDGTGAFPTVDNLIAGPAATAVAIADMDCDNRLDIVAANDTFGVGSVTVLLNGGSRTFPDVEAFDVDADPRSVVAIQLDSVDGPDIATANTNSSTVSVLLNEGCIPCTESGPNCISPTLQIRGWWPLDEEAPAGFTPDHTGCSPGVLVNAPVIDSGKVGCAVQLDSGAESYVRVPHQACLNVGQGAYGSGSGSFTIEGWIRASDLSFAPIVDKRALNSGFQLYIKTGSLFFELRTRIPLGNGVFSYPSQIIGGGGGLSLDTWHHVAATVKRTQSTSEGALFLDGAVLTTFVPLVGKVNTTLDLLIGADQSLSTFFSGQIDEITYYGKPLGQAQISAIHAAGPDGKCK